MGNNPPPPLVPTRQSRQQPTPERPSVAERRSSPSPLPLTSLAPSAASDAPPPPPPNRFQTRGRFRRAPASATVTIVGGGSTTTAATAAPAPAPPPLPSQQNRTPPQQILTASGLSPVREDLLRALQARERGEAARAEQEVSKQLFRTPSPAKKRRRIEAVAEERRRERAAQRLCVSPSKLKGEARVRQIIEQAKQTHEYAGLACFSLDAVETYLEENGIDVDVGDDGGSTAAAAAAAGDASRRIAFDADGSDDDDDEDGDDPMGEDDDEGKTPRFELTEYPALPFDLEAAPALPPPKPLY